MPEDAPEKIIDIKPEEPKKTDRPFLSSLKWGVIFIVIVGLAALAVNYFLLQKLDMSDEAKEKILGDDKPRERVVFESTSFKRKIKEAAEEQKVPSEIETKVEVAGPKLPEPSADYKNEVAALSAKLNKLENANKNLIVYFTARDLKELIGEPEHFSSEVNFLRIITNDNPEISGKVDILEQSISNIKTTQQLAEQLHKLEDQMSKASDNSFVSNVEYALGDLVRVSKVKGEVAAGDYLSIIKRAEITLDKKQVSTAELKQVVAEMETLGKPAQPWILEANNLIRVLEVCDYIIGYSKARVAITDTTVEQ